MHWISSSIILAMPHTLFGLGEGAACTVLAMSTQALVRAGTVLLTARSHSWTGTLGCLRKDLVSLELLALHDGMPDVL
jgi:hypothetical protein